MSLLPFKNQYSASQFNTSHTLFQTLVQKSGKKREVKQIEHFWLWVVVLLIGVPALLFGLIYLCTVIV